jgi:Domain of unknown function (DUF1905)
MDEARYAVTADVWVYAGDGGWHFVTVPDEVTDEIRARFYARQKAFGRLPVRARIGSSTWDTSLFFDRNAGSYVLPLKSAIRAQERIEAGQRVTATLTLGSVTD